MCGWHWVGGSHMGYNRWVCPVWMTLGGWVPYGLQQVGVSLVQTCLTPVEGCLLHCFHEINPWSWTNPGSLISPLKMLLATIVPLYWHHCPVGSRPMAVWPPTAEVGIAIRHRATLTPASVRCHGDEVMTHLEHLLPRWMKLAFFSLCPCLIN